PGRLRQAGSGRVLRLPVLRGLLLSGCKTGIACVPAKRAGQSGVSSSPTMVRVLRMLQVRGGQGSEQRRQRAPHLAEVLQKLSVKRFTATSCNGLRTPGEQSGDYQQRDEGGVSRGSQRAPQPPGRGLQRGDVGGGVQGGHRPLPLAG